MHDPFARAGAIPNVQPPGASGDLLWDIIMAIVTYIHTCVSLASLFRLMGWFTWGNSPKSRNEKVCFLDKPPLAPPPPTVCINRFSVQDLFEHQTLIWVHVIKPIPPPCNNVQKQPFSYFFRKLDFFLQKIVKKYKKIKISFFLLKKYPLVPKISYMF